MEVKEVVANGKTFIFGSKNCCKDTNYLLKLNDALEYNFSDKEMHFLIIGAMGMAMIFMVHPLFKWLVKNNHIMVISWIYHLVLRAINKRQNSKNIPD